MRRLLWLVPVAVVAGVAAWIFLVTPNTVERIRYPLRYKAIVTGAKYVPMGLLQRLQSMGRK